MHVLDTMGLDEAADYLRCQPSTVQELASKKKLPGTKIGKEWVFVRSHLADYVKSRYDQTVSSAATDKGAKEAACQFADARIQKIGTPSSHSKESQFRDQLALRVRRKQS